MEDINIKQVWGKLLTRLRESNEVALFASCGEVSNILLKEDKIVLQTDKKYLADLIGDDKNILILKRAARFLGYDFDFSVEVLESKNEKIDKDIIFLKEKLGKFLIID